MVRAGFHKPIYTLPQALTLCAELLCLKKLLKGSAQSVKRLCAQLLAFMKSTPGERATFEGRKFALWFSQKGANSAFLGPKLLFWTNKAQNNGKCIPLPRAQN